MKPAVRAVVPTLLLPLLLALALPPRALAHGDAHGSYAVPPEDLAVYRIRATTEQLGELRNGYDVWTYAWRDGEAIALLSSANVEELEGRGFTPTLDVERTENELKAASGRELGAGRGSGIPGFPCYRTVEETYADLAQRALDHPTLASWIDIGDSWEKANTPDPGYDVRALVLTNSAIAGDKPDLVVMAAMHAREYTTAELVTRFAEYLLDGYGTDPEITWLLDQREIHILPQVNPDGRKRAESGLLWRKNADNDFCANTDNRGVDLNRNASFLWGSGGGFTCGETYRGPSAGSEPETQAVEGYLAAVFPDQRGDALTDPAPDDAEGVFISVHSFGELVLFPWEATATQTPNHDQLQTLGRKFGFYTDYSVCLECLGTASGTTPDEAYGEYGVAAYTFELGDSFFESCTPFESTIYPDNRDALLYAAKAARRPYQEPLGPEAIQVVATPPVVEAGEPVTLTAVLDDTRFDSNGFGNEPTQTIAAAFVSVDLPPSQQPAPSPLAPVDGTFDASSEAVSGVLDTTGLAVGRHLVYVFGEDSGGRRGVPTAVFLDIAEPPVFADDFETGNLSRWSSVVP
ncbi:MAG: M14 family zinc carboxypeptidase [Acidobacteriota bacterium]